LCAAKERGQEKRATCVGKWPKSREETPKEGSDSAKRHRTAAICSRIAPKASGIRVFLMQTAHGLFCADVRHAIQNIHSKQWINPDHVGSGYHRIASPNLNK
jgi:hypothetical protein